MKMTAVILESFSSRFFLYGFIRYFFKDILGNIGLVAIYIWMKNAREKECPAVLKKMLKPTAA